MAQQLADAFLRVLALRRVDFPMAQRPVAPAPTGVRHCLIESDNVWPGLDHAARVEIRLGLVSNAACVSLRAARCRCRRMPCS